jgi:hypothetical protein
MTPTRLLVLLFVFVILSGLNYGYYLLQPGQANDWILNGPTPRETGYVTQDGQILPAMSPGPQLNQIKNRARFNHVREFRGMVTREVVLVILAGVGIVLLARRR